MFCKICLQGVEEKDRPKKPKDFNDEEMAQHLVDAHGYPAPVEPEAPPLTNEELSEKVAELEAAIADGVEARLELAQSVAGWKSTFEEIATRLDALEAVPHRKGSK